MIRLYTLFSALILLAACSGDSTPSPSTPTATASPPAQSVQSAPPLDGVLTVAWIEDNNPFVWRSDNPETIRQLNAEDVTQVTLSPDGEHLLLVRDNRADSQSLWLIDTNGGEPQSIQQDILSVPDNAALRIRQIRWVDDGTVLFNTSLLTGDFYGTPQNDLYRINVDAMVIERLLNAGEGGAFTHSPNGQQVAITFPGTYNETNGAVRLYNLTNNGGLSTIFNFDGVATGSHFPFYPYVTWVDDTTFRLAIPDPDQLYNENDEDAPPFVLYEVNNGTDEQQIGTLRASLFGVPVWNADGTKMAYLRRGTVNTFEIVMAEGNGDNQQIINQGDVGFIGIPQWTSQGHLVTVTTRLNVLHETGRTGEVETAPIVGTPIIAGEVAVFSTREDSDYALRYVVFDDDTLTPVTIIDGLTGATFSAVFVQN